MLPRGRRAFLGKLANDLDRTLANQAGSGASGRTQARVIARGDGWSVSDVVCTSGPSDRPFEEQHEGVSIAVVVAGSFQYRSSNGRAMLTPGSLLLGNPGQCFECGHEHAAGDRCVAFRYSPEMFEQIAADVGSRRGARGFSASRVPPLRELAPLATRAAAAVAFDADVSWEETAVELAAEALRLTAVGSSDAARPTSGAVARVTETVRRIEADPSAAWTLAQLAADARQSPFHYLRLFQQLTGVTPHQFVLRARLREAALVLLSTEAKVIEVALGAGFGDVSNFNAAFRREFSVSPRAYRKASANGSRLTATGRP